MSITEELRTWVDAYPWRKDRDAAEARALIDRIDVAHGREVDEARETVFSMPNHRVALPMDADGVPIHLDDELCPVDTPEFHSPVEFMTLTEKGWLVDGDCDPSELRHWEAPSIEDLLNEFANRVDRSGHQWGLDADKTVAEYAERIREAMD